MLHYAWDEYVLAVADSVNFDFYTHKILVDKHGVFYLLRKNDVHIFDYVGVGMTYRHILSAKHVRRSEQRGISYLVGDFQRLFFRHYREALRTLDIKFFQKFVKLLSILRHIYILSLRTQNLDFIFFEHLGELYRRLSAESYDHAVRFFCLNYRHNVFVGQRLEIKSVGSVKVCGYRLGIVVDDDDFISFAFQRPHAVYGCIVEFNTLTDADRT